MKNINPTETKTWKKLENHFNANKKLPFKKLFNENSNSRK